MNLPKLQFDFENFKGDKERIEFAEPVCVIIARSINEVETSFKKAEKYLQEGYYVAGYVSYEAAPAFDEAYKVHESPCWPLVWFGVFNKPEEQGKTKTSAEYKVSDWTLEDNFESYQEGIQQIKAAIEAGDTYQVNYTTRLSADFSGDAFSFYRQLAANQKSGYGAYLDLGDGRKILSASPELFFRRSGNTLKTKPMKGTAKRGRTLEEDEKLKSFLRQSEKEQAENLMIVDLLRNDLGRVAVPGSVHVSRLFKVETYPTVHQMTSTVEAKVEKDLTLWEIFSALFPCGSITGAPKIRTMEYIAGLEQSPREVYCGAIGYITPEKEAVFNVPIRTVMLDGSKAVFGTGGGITWDSTPYGEYEELQMKARLLSERRPDFQLLESMRLENGAISLLPYHIKRLKETAQYFNYTLDERELRKTIDQLSQDYKNGAYKVRLLVSENGRIATEAAEITEDLTEAEAFLADSPVDPSNPFLYHKTTYRDVYNTRKKGRNGLVLLWNEDEELTEFTIGNLVVKANERFLTPPVKSGLLRGTCRESLLNQGIIEEQIIFKKDLCSLDEIWMVNGVRGWVRIHLV
ncbi:aminodeoxychorismate synthase component I [Halobacillus massiliensis]|uniref:aminodeoxychorismate synthase component I n=1 Tax=Halobacillus massiliensis TaxID=1926286 RepID=UPI0009E2752E|nr:aminodeoxychorismate synthase component I [Halobacillus massiliensis]